MNFGELHLPTKAGMDDASLRWIDFSINQLLIVIAVLLTLLVILDFIRLWPMLQACMIRARGNISMEHSVRQARVRNHCAQICLLIFCIIASCYYFAGEEFLSQLDLGWRSLAIIGIMCGYLILRSLIYRLVSTAWPLPRADSETRTAVHTALYNYFLIAVCTMLLAIGIMSLLRVPYDARRLGLLIIIGFFWLLSLVRTGQILRGNCTGLGMFLYLCALEILPTTVLVAIALIL